MSDQRLIIANCLAFTSKDVRDRVHDQLSKIAENARKNEPDALKYAICLPDDPNDESTIYVFEEFTDQASFDKHMSSDLVVAITKQESDPSLRGPDFSHRRLSYIPGAQLSRTSRLPAATPQPGQVNNPYVLWATITDPQPADIEALAPFGEKVVKFAQDNEPDTIFYADVRVIDSESNLPRADFIAALEVYASKEACFAHLQNDAVKALAVEGHKLHSTFDIVKLNMVEGFLTR